MELLNWLNDNLLWIWLVIGLLQIPVVSNTIFSMGFVWLVYLVLGDLLISIEWFLLTLFLPIPEWVQAEIDFWTPYVLMALMGYATAMIECREHFPNKFILIKKSKLEKLGMEFKIKWE